LRWVAWAATLIPLLFLTDGLDHWLPGWQQVRDTWGWHLGVATVLAAFLLVTGAQIYRYRRLSTPIERQQTKWVVFGFAALIGYWLLSFPYLLLGLPPISFALNLILSHLLFLLLPLTIVFSILRHRLWAIDPILNRTLVYSLLTALIILLYILSVGLLSALTQAQNDFTLPLLILAVVVGAAVPLRQWLQGVVDRVVPRPVAADAGATKPTARRQGWGDRLFFGFFALFSGMALLWLLAGLAPGIGLLLPPFLVWLRSLARGAVWPPVQEVARDLVMATYYSEPPQLLLFEYLFSLINLPLGMALLRRRPHDWVARLLAIGMVGTAAIFNLQTHSYLNAAAWPLVDLVHELLHLLAGGAYALALLLFPSGRLPTLTVGWLRPLRVVSAPLRVPLIVLLIIAVSGLTFDGEPAAFVLFFGLVAPVVGISAQALRYVTTESAEERQLSRTVILALGLGLALTVLIGLVSWLVLSPVLGLPYQVRQTLERITFFVFPLLYTMIPISLWLIVLRHRLWELNLLINRSLVYGVLTAIVVALYVVLVGVLGVALQGQVSWLLSVLATGLIAVLFQPLRQRLQGAVNRLMYGERDDPVTVLAALRQRLEATSTPEMILTTIVETLCHALKLPYAAIALKQGEVVQVAASHGAPTAGIETIPLLYQRERIGELRTAPRAPGETLSPADHRLIREIAQHAGAAAHAARLTADLQQSRERLVTAREEERRRLRRDLHDGLGPQLATLSLQVDAARNLLRRDPAAADRQLVEVKGQMQAAIADIRRLVYELRPPALDQLGLASALREYAASCSGVNGLHIAVEAPERLPPLPAAVEVAAYRIALEAITNVIRHAQAHQCTVQLTVDTALHLSIRDDGVGLPADVQAGVGLTSLRERVAELGGNWRIDTAAGQGTQILVKLPLVSPV
jgi:signal transduction histidine kinase